MTEYYIVRKGHTLTDLSGEVLAEAGDVIGLETDSADNAERKIARGVLTRAGGSAAVVAADKPKGKKRAKGYKTREMSAEAAAAEPADAPEEEADAAEEEVG